MKKGKVIIVTILLCVLSGILAYFISLKIDMLRKGGNVDIKVVFDDTETYIIPSVKKLTKEEALKEWPYKLKINNSGSAKGLYQILIEDISNSIPRDDLEYALFQDEKEVQSGSLSKIKDNILYTYEIDGGKEQKYDLYIWCTNDHKDEDKYEYKLTFNVIKDGGPGF